MINYDRPYIKDHFLHDCSTACQVVRTGTTFTATGKAITSRRVIKGIPRRRYDIGPVEIEEIEHVRLDLGGCFLGDLGLTGTDMAGPSGTSALDVAAARRDRERGYASADEVLERERDGRRSPTRRKLDKSSNVISRMLSRTRLRPSNPPPLLHAGQSFPAGYTQGQGQEPKHIHHLQNGKLPSFDESFDVSAYYTGDGAGCGGSGGNGFAFVASGSMVPEFGSPKRTRVSEDGQGPTPSSNPYARAQAHINTAAGSTSDSDARSKWAGQGSPSRTPGKALRLSPSRSHYPSNLKLFPTSSPRAYQYEPLPPLPLSPDLQGSFLQQQQQRRPQQHQHAYPHLHAHNDAKSVATSRQAVDGSFSSTRGIKDPPFEPYPTTTAPAHRRIRSDEAARQRRQATKVTESDEGADRTLNANVDGNSGSEMGVIDFTACGDRKRPASIAASTIPLPPSPPHVPVMPSSFVLPLELRRKAESGDNDGDDGAGEGVVRMGSVKRERVPTPMPGDAGITSVRLSPHKGNRSHLVDGPAGPDEQGKKSGLPVAPNGTLGLGDTPAAARKEDVFADFDRYFTDFPSARSAGPSGSAPGSGSGEQYSDRAHLHPTYRTAEYPISAALSRERSLPTPPPTNGSGTTSSSGSVHSHSQHVGVAASNRIESAIINLQSVIQTLQAAGADQAGAVLRQAELEMRLQSMDEELGGVREANVRLEVQIRREREERRKLQREWEGREEGWKEKVKVAEEATNTAQTSLHHLHLSQSASSSRIQSLENDLRASGSRNTSLQTHINELESEIVRLGGAFDLVKADYARREEQLKKRLAEAEFMHHALKESGARIGRELEACKKKGEELEKRSRGYI